ncbi:UDP-N-acetylmuramate--L-alanine ligase [Baaleninema sp.]|uniref:UDP-N-acetylmuramate--L-alanine ligase n=1 Tax=Baaleninema sp. TaxID=3101197 RepID=UPI003CFD3F21
MPNSVDFSGKPFHFIGIGGIGMSALAYILAKRQLPVYGSDLKSNSHTQRLQQLGAHIFWEQNASNLEFFHENLRSDRPRRVSSTDRTHLNGRGQQPDRSLPQVICSTAIDATNAEYRAALDLGCPIFHRSDVLAALIRDYKSIAVAGTHGKTTTSSMVGFLLLHAGLDPTIVVGGDVKAWEGNARLGLGDYLVAEADESDGSLVKFDAAIGIVTNIELDHPDHYQSLDEVTQIFRQFADRCRLTIGCIDCEVVRDRIAPDLTYSLDPTAEADYCADRVTFSANGASARVWERGEILGTLELKLLGRHNLSNALAAVAVGRHLGLDFETIASALKQFEGARRRFELRGIADGIRFIDDYAHHPSEIQATLSAARLQAKGNPEEIRRVVAVFQPHRYSRTQTFLTEFAQSFSDADVVVVSDVYSAGEAPFDRTISRRLADAIAQQHQCVYYRPKLPELADFLGDLLETGDLALFLGAGDLNQIVPRVMEERRQVERDRPSVEVRSAPSYRIS